VKELNVGKQWGAKVVQGATIPRSGGDHNMPRDRVACPHKTSSHLCEGVECSQTMMTLLNIAEKELDPNQKSFIIDCMLVFCCRDLLDCLVLEVKHSYGQKARDISTTFEVRTVLKLTCKAIIFYALFSGLFSRIFQRRSGKKLKLIYIFLNFQLFSNISVYDS
jgi:hypothetical protein